MQYNVTLRDPDAQELVLQKDFTADKPADAAAAACAVIFSDPKHAGRERLTVTFPLTRGREYFDIITRPEETSI